MIAKKRRHSYTKIRTSSVQQYDDRTLRSYNWLCVHDVTVKNSNASHNSMTVIAILMTGHQRTLHRSRIGNQNQNWTSVYDELLSDLCQLKFGLETAE
jgi:hypothetical protein